MIFISPGILDGGRYLVEERIHLVVNVSHSRDGPVLENVIVCNKYKNIKFKYNHMLHMDFAGDINGNKS